MICQKKIQAVQDVVKLTIGKNIDMPRVVVLGSQSSGKSSVLEQILQKDVLPRGHNLVTRCPVIITLRQLPEETILVDGVTVPQEEVSSILVNTMSKNCGDNKGIVDSPIHLEIHMPDTLDLVLVDLPGLTKIPVGDQPGDIEQQVQRMAKKYISPASTLILCVIAANADIATCESLKFAKEVDPNYERTLGVLTKIDIMDEGTDCTEILNNVYPQLRHGYVGVINRSQQSIAQCVSIHDSTQREETWFAEHPIYSKYGDKIGSKYLMKLLGSIFTGIVEKEVPNLCAKLEGSIKEMRVRLAKLGESMTEKRLVAEYKSAIGSLVGIGGESIISCCKVNMIKKWSTAILNSRIHMSLDNLSKKILNGDHYVLLPDRAIEGAIKESSLVISKNIMKISDSSFEELLSAVQSCTHPSYSPAIRFLNSMVCEMLRAQYDIFKTEATKTHRLQCCCINLDHPDFNKTGMLSNMVAERIKQNSKGWGVDTKVNIFTAEFIHEMSASLVYEYMGITARDMKDVTIKLLRHMISEFIINTVFARLDLIESNPEMITDDPKIRKERADLEKDVATFTDALNELRIHK